MRRNARNIAILLCITITAYSGYGFACNRQHSLSVAAEAAKDIGGGTRDVIKAVGEAYDQKLISLEQKDKLADILKAIAVGGKKGVDAIEFLQKQGIENPSPEQRINLTRIFDDEVVAPFLNLLTELGKLSDSNSAAIRAALASVRTAIVLLSGKIGRADVIREIQLREVIHA